MILDPSWWFGGTWRGSVSVSAHPMRSNTAANLGWRSLGPTEIAKQLQQGDFYLENLMVSRKVKWRTRWSCLRESRGELEGITSTIAGSKMQKPPSQSHQNTPEQSSLTERRRNETQRWMRREAPPAGERNPHPPTKTMDGWWTALHRWHDHDAARTKSDQAESVLRGEKAFWNPEHTERNWESKAG